MADDQSLDDVDVEILVEQVLLDLKDLLLSPPSSQADSDIVIIDYDEFDDEAVDPELAVAELNYRLMSLPRPDNDRISTQSLSLLHEAHIALNINSEMLMRRFPGDAASPPQTPGNAERPADYLSCTLCAHMLALLYRNNVFGPQTSNRADNPPAPHRAHAAQAGNHPNEPRPSTSRGDQAANNNARQQQHEPMEATVSSSSDLPTQMPGANAKFEKPPTLGLNLPSTSGQSTLGKRKTVDSPDIEDDVHCAESSDDEYERAASPMEDANLIAAVQDEEDRRRKFHRIKKEHNMYLRKFKK